MLKLCFYDFPEAHLSVSVCFNIFDNIYFDQILRLGAMLSALEWD